ncbi:unnamed protein product [Schistocephalus solidus]|uniref:ADF-H domain-containing protein n=1 Tax=Schistocephalus solidus TaxID=70667 RepID=A0A183T6K0_SCHSO|nr:unnamed protein product [Schistocephalus solidus]
MDNYFGQAAANAAYEKVGHLPNLTRYLRARAHVIFFRRATLMCFQTRRGAAVEVVAPQHAPGHKKPVESVKEFIEQGLKELVEVERLGDGQAECPFTYDSTAMKEEAEEQEELAERLMDMDCGVKKSEECSKH